MSRIKIGDNRYIELLSEKKNIEAKHIVIANAFGELTTSLKKTNGKPLLSFEMNDTKYYIREKFEIKSELVKWEQGTQWHISGGTVNSTKAVLKYDEGYDILNVAVNSDKFIAYRHNRSGNDMDAIWQSENGYSYTGTRFYDIYQGNCQTKALNPIEITPETFNNSEINVSVNIADLGINKENIIWDKYDSTNTNLNCKIQIIAINTGTEIQCFVRRICTSYGGDNTFILNLAHYMMIELA